MNFRLSIFVAVVFICCLIPNVSSFTVLKNLLNVFKSSTSKSTAELSTAVSNEDTFQHTVSSLGRSSLVSEHDNKFPTASQIFKDGVFRNKFVIHLQDLFSRKSIDSGERSGIVNTEGDEFGNLDFGQLSDDNSIDFDSVNLLANKFDQRPPPPPPQMFFGTHTEDREDDDDEDRDEDDDDEFSSDLNRKRLTANEPKSNHTSNLTTTYQYLNSFKTIHHLNETHHRISNATHKSNNKTNTTSYTYLDGHAEPTHLAPTILHSKLLGNTLESVEKILNKYTFLNLYPTLTINDTHNDRDLHQAGDQRVVLKANFADYYNYANTEKSTVHGQPALDQNLSDLAFGNYRVHNQN